MKGRFVKAGDAYDYDPLSQTRSFWVCNCKPCFWKNKRKETDLQFGETWYYFLNNRCWYIIFLVQWQAIRWYHWGLGFCGEKRWSMEVKELVSDASPKSSDKQKRKMVSDIIHQDCLIALPWHWKFSFPSSFHFLSTSLSSFTCFIFYSRENIHICRP